MKKYENVDEIQAHDVWISGSLGLKNYNLGFI